MRVTNKMLSNSFLTDMRRNLENMSKLQGQMTSGKEIRRPSDDPFKVSRAMQLHTDISTNKQYKENISDTINWLDITDTALGQVGDVLQRVRELLVSAGNAGYGDSERLAIKNEINEKIGEVSQILNTNFDGAYIFGGTRATTKPVDVIGGTTYKDATVAKVDDLTAWTGKSIRFTNSANDTLNVGPLLANDTKDLNSLAKKLNDSINADSNFTGKLNIVPNISDNSLMLVSIENIKINKVPLEPFPTELTDGHDIVPATVKSLGNTALEYYNRNGGFLDTLNDISTDDGKQYGMINSKLKVQISQGVYMDYNVTATEILQFKSGNKNLDLREIFAAITNHLDGKDFNGTAVSADAVKDLVGEDLQNITDTISNLLRIRAEVGAKQNRMDSANEKNIDATFNMTEILSKTEDIDITEKTMEYATMQTVYLASLQTSAKVLQPSLIDYL